MQCFLLEVAVVVSLEVSIKLIVLPLVVLQVKNHIWVFVNALIENPSFDSQTKENMTLQTKSFGSKCPLSDKFVRAVRTLLIHFQLFTPFSFFWFLL